MPTKKTTKTVTAAKKQAKKKAPKKTVAKKKAPAKKAAAPEPKKLSKQDAEIKQVVTEVVGEDSMPIVEYLKNKQNISDFKIAEEVDKDIHEVRNILYRLYNNNLVSYYRKKDRQKGWYISYWTFNKPRVKDLLVQTHVSKIKKFEDRLAQELANQGKMYMSPDASIRVPFERAVDLEFRCPETGAILVPVDNTRTIEFLKDKIQELKASKVMAAQAAANN